MAACEKPALDGGQFLLGKRTSKRGRNISYNIPHATTGKRTGEQDTDMTQSAPRPETPFSAKLMKPARAALPFATAALILWLLLRDTDFALLGRLATAVKPQSVALLIAASLAIHVLISGIKWTTALRFMDIPVTCRDAFLSLIGAFPLGTVTPFKAGDVTKAMFLKSRYGVPVEQGISCVIINRFTNMIAVLIFVTVFSYVPGVWGYPVAALLACCLAILFYARHPLERISSLVAASRITWLSKLQKIFAGLAAAFVEMRTSRKMTLTLIALGMEFMEILYFILALRMFQVHVPLAVAAFGVPLIILATNIPISVSGFGIREASMVLLFSQYGSREQLLSAGFAISFIDKILISAIGLFFTKSFLAETMTTQPESMDGT